MRLVCVYTEWITPELRCRSADHTHKQCLLSHVHIAPRPGPCTRAIGIPPLCACATLVGRQQANVGGWCEYTGLATRLGRVCPSDQVGWSAWIKFGKALQRAAILQALLTGMIESPHCCSKTSAAAVDLAALLYSSDWGEIPCMNWADSHCSTTVVDDDDAITPW